MRSAGGRSGGARGQRSIGAASLLIGPDPLSPAWSRSAPLDRFGPAAGWPPGWLEAAARETAIEGSRLPAGASPDLGAREGSLVVDAFAAGDLLRLEATRWAEGAADPGARVAAARVGVREIREPRGGPAGSRVLVEAGRLVPGAPGRRGDRVRGASSWRSGTGPAWTEWVLEVGGPAESWPAEGHVLTRILPLRSHLLGAGHLLRRGRPVARWGPIGILPPHWFLARVAASIGPAVRDATGAPVSCPALVVRWGPHSGAR